MMAMFFCTACDSWEDSLVRGSFRLQAEVKGILDDSGLGFLVDVA